MPFSSVIYVIWRVFSVQQVYSLQLIACLETGLVFEWIKENCIKIVFSYNARFRTKHINFYKLDRR